ncbi:MAG: DUF6671 family protein [Bacteroidota bacterium]
MEFFKGRKAVIATRHQKDKVIVPLIEKELGLIGIIPPDLDTDKLGTFSGEVERIGNPLTVLRNKCLMAIEATGIEIAIANEGSFGPHPEIFFAHAGDELIMLYDKENNIEIVERELNLDTNFGGAVIETEKQLIDFAGKAGFPSHGIILKKAKDDYSLIIKDSRNFEDLIANYNRIRKESNQAYAETDMRAHNNPTRMNNIQKVTEKLISKAKSVCAICGTPGFGVVEAVKGLPCLACGIPTKSTLKHICRCLKCSYESEILFPYKKQAEDPQFCDFCNP